MKCNSSLPDEQNDINNQYWWIVRITIFSLPAGRHVRRHVFALTNKYFVVNSFMISLVPMPNFVVCV